MSCGAWTQKATGKTLERGPTPSNFPQRTHGVNIARATCAHLEINRAVCVQLRNVNRGISRACRGRHWQFSGAPQPGPPRTPAAAASSAALACHVHTGSAGEVLAMGCFRAPAVAGMLKHWYSRHKPACRHATIAQRGAESAPGQQGKVTDECSKTMLACQSCEARGGRHETPPTVPPAVALAEAKAAALRPMPFGCA